MNAYQQVLTLKEDYQILQLSFKAAVRGMEEITAEIRQRQEMEKEADAARRAALEAVINDQNRPLSVRKMADSELAAMPEYTPLITACERKAYQAEEQAARDALADLRKTVEALREATAKAKAEVETIRKDTVGKTEFCLLDRTLDERAQEWKLLNMEA